MRWKKISCYMQTSAHMICRCHQQYAFYFIQPLSASVILSLEKLLIFPPHNSIFSDLPEKNAFAATGTLYFAAFILPKTMMQSTLAPLSFKPSNKRRSITSFVKSSFVIFDTHIYFFNLPSVSAADPGGAWLELAPAG